jgi:hypothetical protein
MGKIKNPIRFSDEFGVSSASLTELGVLDPVINVDTRLFIDPLLLSGSKHPELRDAAETYQNHFKQVIELLAATKEKDDAAWRTARKLLSFPEVKNTCLGYGASSVSGSGGGAYTTDAVMNTAKEIVDFGVTNPNLFIAMALFEEGIGPDTISDMTTNIILGDLIRFNQRILGKLNVPLKSTRIILKNGRCYEANLPINPNVKGGKTGIILTPLDILRDLPVALDWEDVSFAAAENSVLRQQINEQIGEIWKRKTLKDKDEIRQWALEGKESFNSLLELIDGAKKQEYDIEKDPQGLVFWHKLANTLALTYPKKIEAPDDFNLETVTAIAREIIEQYRFLIEDRRLSEELYVDNKPRPEKSAQKLFFAVAHSYCKANNIDLTPEADTGNGPVDFKLSQGYNGRVLVEIKLSTNSLTKGYTHQLETYTKAEEAVKSFYIVIVVHDLAVKKRQELLDLQKEESDKFGYQKEIVFINGRRRPSASHLK